MKRSSAVLIGAVLAGVALGAALVPALFRRIPTDLTRVGVLLRALHDRQLEPSIVVFGSSTVGSAVDTRALTAALAGAPLALNVTTAQQTLAESYLFYDELPSSVRTVVQMVTERHLSPFAALEETKLNAYHMYGYRPSRRTIDAIRRIYGEPTAKALERSSIAQAFAARWVIRSYLDVGLSDAWRVDLDMNRFTYDLFYPQAFRARIPEQTFRAGIARWLATWGEPNPETVRTIREMLEEMILRNRESGRRFVAFVPPVHPEVLAGLNDAVRTEFERLLEGLLRHQGVTVVDARALLRDEDFRDWIHPLESGATTVTAYLAERLEPRS